MENDPGGGELETIETDGGRDIDGNPVGKELITTEVLGIVTFTVPAGKRVSTDATFEAAGGGTDGNRAHDGILSLSAAPKNFASGLQTDALTAQPVLFDKVEEILLPIEVRDVKSAGTGDDDGQRAPRVSGRGEARKH